jgi:hypothetical protein
MRLIHKVGFSPEEIETYRQLVFNNLVHGMRLVIESLSVFQITVEKPQEVCFSHIPILAIYNKYTYDSNIYL